MTPGGSGGRHWGIISQYISTSADVTLNQLILGSVEEAEDKDRETDVCGPQMIWNKGE